MGKKEKREIYTEYLKPGISGYLLAVSAAILWGTLGIFAKILYSYKIDPVTIVFFRALFAFLICLFILALLDPSSIKIKLKHVLFFALFGIISVGIFYALYFYTIKITTIATAAILLYTSPAFVVILSWLFFREPLSASKITALFFVMIGCAFVVGIYRPGILKINLLGILAGLGSGLTFGLYTIFSKRALQSYKPRTVLLYSLGFGTAFLYFILPKGAIVNGNYPLIFWTLALILAIFPTLLAFAFYISSLRHIEASRASIIITIEPVAAAVFAYFILGEYLEPLQIFGGLMVIAGAILAQSSSKPNR